MNRAFLQQLQERIRAIEVRERTGADHATPIPELGDLFPDGLPGGTLVDLLPACEGASVWTLALLMGKPLCETGKIFVVADAQQSFYPPAASGLGLDLQRTLIVRTPIRQHVLTALVQSLRCPAIGAVLGSFDRLTSAEYRQLQLAAETGGGVGFLIRPHVAVSAGSFAAIRLLVAQEAGGAGRRMRVEVVRSRGIETGTSWIVEVDHETRAVCVPAGLADATPEASPPRAEPEADSDRPGRGTRGDGDASL